MSSENSLFAELSEEDREGLMRQMAALLPVISGEMGTTPGGIAWRTGLDPERVTHIISGRRKMKWSEYMSILFVLWDDEAGRREVEKRGLFPDGLRRAMTENRNYHGEG